MRKLSEITLQEPLGIPHRRQYTEFELPAGGCRGGFALRQDGQPVPADFCLKKDTVQVGVFLALNAHQETHFELFSDDADALPVPPPALNLTLPDGAVGCTFGFGFAANGVSASGSVTFAEPAELTVCREDGGASSLTTLRFCRSQNEIYRLTVRAFRENADLLIEEAACGGDGELRLAFGDFTPRSVYARMHSPGKGKGASDEWKRICCPAAPGTVELQPFYVWDVDCATAAEFHDGARSVALAAVCPSRWQGGRAARIAVRTGENGLCAVLPVTEFKRVWALSLAPADAAEPEDFLLSEKDDYHNWGFLFGLPLEKRYTADRLIAEYGGPNLTRILRFAAGFGDVTAVGNGLLVNAGQTDRIRRRVAEDPWLSQTVAAHARDKAGYDPAGVYLATGDETFARSAAEEIENWLRQRARLFVDFGYSLHELVAIRLTRPLRLVALDYDLICRSPSITAERHRRIMTAFAFLFDCLADPDYWPDPSCGFSKGNHNFHSDWFSCLGVLACLLPGHTQSLPRRLFAEREIGAELSAAVYPGGAWIEAPNYQCYSMSYLMLLFAVFKNAGGRDFFITREFMSAMDFLAEIQTPRDVRSGVCMMPTIGDTAANYWSQGFQYVCACVASATADTRPAFSARMMSAWDRCGQPYICPGGEKNSSFKVAAAMIDRTLPRAPEPHRKTRYFPGFGAVCRSQQDGYLAFKAGAAGQHYDHDEGSLIWYEGGAPLLCDVGGQYFPSCDASYMHNRISVDHKTDWCRGELTHYETNDSFDSCTLQVDIDTVQVWSEFPVKGSEWNFRLQPPPEKIPAHRWTRQLVYFKQRAAVAVLDRIDGPLPTDQNFLLFADELVKNGTRFHGKGQFGRDITVFSSAAQSEVLHWSYEGLDEPSFLRGFGMDWRSYRWMWAGEMKPMGERVCILRLRDPNSTYLTLLCAGDDPGSVRFEDGAILWQTDRLLKISPGETAAQITTV